ncbi:macro domain-like protein [Epithele typhae]|uniref:macro domain-like protein n=1 Tax=Epithele typhae TaxID=378194 RepID=UPI0020076047|nr:macro domain-like protein [Epithele typhae]KAH9912763.1 macro domain-like protein [Epithele typhae]
MDALNFILFDLNPRLVESWKTEFDKIVPPECAKHVEIKHCTLGNLQKPIDCLVSPANSFGRLDGSYDAVLSEALAPASDPDALTRAAQTTLYARWRGFAPPGTCTLVPLTGTPCADNPTGCRVLALCPTMRIPSSVSWHREIVYNCVWSLLVAVDQHNADAGPGERIRNVAMTGLATGVGRVPVEVCAVQTALAFAHFHEAKADPEKWSRLEWGDIMEMPLSDPSSPHRKR